MCKDDVHRNARRRRRIRTGSNPVHVRHDTKIYLILSFYNYEMLNRHNRIWKQYIVFIFDLFCFNRAQSLVMLAIFAPPCTVVTHLLTMTVFSTLLLEERRVAANRYKRNLES